MKENKKIIIIGIFASVIILGIVLINTLSKNGVFKRNDSNYTKELSTTINKTTQPSTTKERFIVEIKGEVYYPGIYEFYDKDEVLIKDIVDAAGGLTPRADSSLLNSVERVENHSSILIGAIGSMSYILKDGETFSKININTCSEADLETLEGIGEVRANAIIQYRKNNGFFSRIEDLLKVDGITETVFGKIKEYITV